MVIRYNYLWANDAASGLREASKERPSAIVVAHTDDASRVIRCVVVPITHSEPKNEADALEIPPAVCRSAGLDAARSWVVMTEYNEFNWPGYDLAHVPGKDPPSFVYGVLPIGFLQIMRERWQAIRRAGVSSAVDRDD